MRPPDDSALLDRARDGDLDAFAEFVRLFERRVRAVLGRLLVDERDVEEATQDTFVQAWRSLDRYRGDATPFTWLYRIAMNEALQRLRRKRVEVGGEQLPDPQPGSEATIENRELASFLGECIRALPSELRAPVVLRDVEGWSNQDVAGALGLSLPATKSRIHRARMQLRVELEGWLKERA